MKEVNYDAKLFYPCYFETWTDNDDLGNLFEPQGIFEDGCWYEWIDKHGNIELARMKLDAYDHFWPNTKIIKEKDVIGFRIPEELKMYFEEKKKNAKNK